MATTDKEKSDKEVLALEAFKEFILGGNREYTLEALRLTYYQYTRLLIINSDCEKMTHIPAKTDNGLYYLNEIITILEG